MEHSMSSSAGGSGGGGAGGSSGGGSSQLQQQMLSFEEKAEIDSRSVYVANVDYSVSAAELESHFMRCGVVQRVTIPTNQDGSAKGFAYVEYDCRESAERAKEELDDTELHGRQLKVSTKRTNIPGMKRMNAPRGGGGGGRGGGGGMPSYRGAGGGSGTGLAGVMAAAVPTPRSAVGIGALGAPGGGMLAAAGARPAPQAAAAAASAAALMQTQHHIGQHSLAQQQLQQQQQAAAVLAQQQAQQQQQQQQPIQFITYPAFYYGMPQNGNLIPR